MWYFGGRVQDAWQLFVGCPFSALRTAGGIWPIQLCDVLYVNLLLDSFQVPTLYGVAELIALLRASKELLASRAAVPLLRTSTRSFEIMLNKRTLLGRQ